MNTKTLIKTLPLSTDDLISLFDNPGQILDIDYSKSSLKDDAFFAYVSNVKIQCRLHGYEDLSYNEKERLLNSFINSKYTMEIENLKETIVGILLNADPKSISFFKEDEIEKYKVENRDRLNQLVQFFNSMLIMIPSISSDFKKLFIDTGIEDGSIAEIDGTDFITPNIYNLTFYPGFIDLFIGNQEEEHSLVFYKGVIDSYQYKNKSFFSLLTDNETAPNLITIFNYFFIENEESEKELKEAI
jgi:hypothetical protein